MDRRRLFLHHIRGLNDVARSDIRYPQQVCQAFGEEAYENLKRRLAMQSLPDDAIDVRQDKIHIILRQFVEGSALRENVTQKYVIHLHAGLFTGMISFAEEHM